MTRLSRDPLFSNTRRLPSPVPIVVPIAGFLLGLAVVFFFMCPRVTDFHPAPDDRAGSYAAIEIRFSAPMDYACTASRFSSDPSVEGDLIVEGDTLRFTPTQPWPTGGSVRVSIRAGACDRHRLPLLAGKSWSFTPSAMRVAYIASSAENSRLMSIPVEGGDATELAAGFAPIQDYSIAPQGNFLVFSTGSYNTPGKLWLLPLNGRSAELLVDCGGDSCHGPAVSPDGSLLAYERARMETSLSGLSVPLHPFVEMLDLTTRKTRVISSQGHTANNPTWSPNGWLSYYDATRRAIVIDDLQGGQTFLPNVTGEQWTWLPDGRGVIFPEIIASGESFGNQDPRLYSHLFLVTESDNRRTDLSDIEQIEDGSPAVSPDGRQLAFARNYFDNRWTPGRQIWIMNLDTFTARPITQTAEYGHSSIRWSPDGLMLVFMRFHETAPTEPPEIWAINADGSNAHRLSTGGYLPQWLP